MLQIDVQDVADRLSATVADFAFVGLARDLGAVRRETIRWPSAWVILLAETAEANRYQAFDAIEQPVTGRIAIIMAVRDIADRTGARAGADLKGLRAQVLLSLGAHVPDGADRAFRFARGQLQSGVDAQGGLFWQDEFTLRFDRRIPIS